MSQHRTYYGEYTLRRWIELLVKKDIILPEYQRHFVWDKRDLKRLVKSLQEGQFIQPITIGLYPQSNGANLNLLLDGQQRLTSILLAYIGYFPNKEKFESAADEIATEDDSALDTSDEDNNNLHTKPIKWTIRELLKQNSSIENIREQISTDDHYNRLDEILLPEDFWDTHFIGFSYIVPNITNEMEVQTFFTLLFRNMNFYGQKLSASESRKSLYYQNSLFTNYFEGKTDAGDDVLCSLKVTQEFKPKQIDFIRYLSVLSQKKIGIKIMVGYSAYNSRESFYADYVAYLLGLEQEGRTDKFNDFDYSKIFPDNTINERYVKLKNSIERIKPYMAFDSHRAFKSWIDADLWLFGLIYYLVFEGKILSSDEKSLNKLKEKIENKIESKDEYYQKRSNSLGNLRSRIDESIQIYQTYVS